MPDMHAATQQLAEISAVAQPILYVTTIWDMLRVAAPRTATVALPR
jgi:hypothetical protein